MQALCPHSCWLNKDEIFGPHQDNISRIRHFLVHIERHQNLTAQMHVKKCKSYAIANDYLHKCFPTSKVLITGKQKQLINDMT